MAGIEDVARDIALVLEAHGAAKQNQPGGSSRS
jgi:hypothetical protein